MRQYGLILCRNTLYKLTVVFIFTAGILGYHIKSCQSPESQISLSPYLPLIQDFKTIFFSIIVEAIPFILLGVFISSIISVFVSEQFIQRLLPNNPVMGVMMAGLIGIFVPLCECGIVPIARRLIAKGVPPGIAVSFMLAVPVVNPVVGFATYQAFNYWPPLAVLRLLFAYTIAVCAGFLLSRLPAERVLRTTPEMTCDCGCGHVHTQESDHSPTHGWKKRLWLTLAHACDEFFDMGRYLFIGAFIASTLQVLVPRDILQGIGQNPLTSTVAMMGLAYMLSICSAADAFVASTFTGQFSTGSLLAFMVFGPMLDIKNTLMLFGSFRPLFVTALVLAIIVLVLSVGVGFNILVGR